MTTKQTIDYTFALLFGMFMAALGVPFGWFLLLLVGAMYACHLLTSKLEEKRK